jgi:hypothetical protein
MLHQINTSTIYRDKSTGGTLAHSLNTTRIVQQSSEARLPSVEGKQLSRESPQRPSP